jgi:hypothetical protein
MKRQAARLAILLPLLFIFPATVKLWAMTLHPGERLRWRPEEFHNISTVRSPAAFESRFGILQDAQQDDGR